MRVVPRISARNLTQAALVLDGEKQRVVFVLFECGTIESLSTDDADSLSGSRLLAVMLDQ